MSHKAFAFDWLCFDTELAPLLRSALSNDNPAQLSAFVHRERSHLTDPYDGDPLTGDWQEALEKGDVQELGDFAITRYYDVKDDSGIGDRWLALEAALQKEHSVALLGIPICEGERCFDPGYQGSYFQTPEIVRHSYSLLRENTSAELQSYLNLLVRCMANQLGTYVTF